MEINKFNTCCISGNRPWKLPWKNNEYGFRFFVFKLKFNYYLKKAYKLGYVNFMTGMALGIDLICSELILKFKKQHPKVFLECVIPCSNQTEKWDIQNKIRYNKILQKADKITYVSNLKYTNYCMKKRNEYMVNNSTLLIAVYNNTPGGTLQTIQYAKSKNLKTFIIKP